MSWNPLQLYRMLLHMRVCVYGINSIINDQLLGEAISFTDLVMLKISHYAVHHGETSHCSMSS